MPHVYMDHLSVSVSVQESVCTGTETETEITPRPSPDPLPSRSQILPSLDPDLARETGTQTETHQNRNRNCTVFANLQHPRTVRVLCWDNSLTVKFYLISMKGSSCGFKGHIHTHTRIRTSCRGLPATCRQAPVLSTGMVVHAW